MSSPEFVKRSIVLTTKLADAMDQMAASQGRSFASLVRDALNFWINAKDSGFVRETDIMVSLSKEELKLMQKLLQYLPMDAPGILKQSWTESLPRLLDQAQARKQNIEDLSKKL